MRRLLVLLTAPLLVSAARAEDLPQFLGPHRDDSSKEIVKPWSGEPKVLWRVAVGEGHSSPVVAGKHVLLHDKVPGKNIERLRSTTPPAACRWPPPSTNRRSTSPAPSASAHAPCRRWSESAVNTFGVTGRLSATLLTHTGGTVGLKPAFSTDVLADFKAKNLNFGASVLAAGRRRQRRPPGRRQGRSVVAVNRTRASVAWKALDDPASYSSPIAFGKGRRQSSS